jgi:hypothetical protein
MQTQMSFAELEYISKKKLTRRERFLAQIEAATPWAQLVAVIKPHYPKGNRGRPPIGLERMLRMYIAQNCFGLSGEGIEDALYDSQAIRRFVGIDLGREATPDATAHKQGQGRSKEAEIDRFLPLMTTSPPPAAPSLGSPPVQQRSRRTGGDLFSGSLREGTTDW